MKEATLERKQDTVKIGPEEAVARNRGKRASVPGRIDCGKTRYQSEWAAQGALNKQAPEMRDFTIRPYYCPRCGEWHNGHADPRDKERALRLDAIDARLVDLRFAASKKCRAEKSALHRERGALWEEARQRMADMREVTG